MTLVQIPKLTTTLEDFLKNLESIEPLFDALSSVVFHQKYRSTLCLCQSNISKSLRSKKIKLQYWEKPLLKFFLIHLEKYIHRKTCKLFVMVKVNRAIRTTFICKNQSGWCLTYKEPLFDADGNLVGIAGISNDLNVPENTHPAFYKMVQVEEYIKRITPKPLLWRI